MPNAIDMRALEQEDDRWKGGNTNKTSAALAALWDDQATGLTINYLRNLGLGNRRNTEFPFQAGITRRLVEALSVVYAAPATRRLVENGKDLSEESISMKAMIDAFALSGYDLLWQRIDALRNLYRTVAVEWVEDSECGAVSAYVFAPHQMRRMPDPQAPHAIERDRATALLIRASRKKEDQLWRVWMRGEDGSRRLWITDGLGDITGPQVSGDGASPYGNDVLPVQLVSDDLPMGEAYLPVPESRVSWALGVNGAINDLAYLVQMEAHSRQVFKDSRAESAPTETGPDAVIHVRDEQGDFKIEGTAAKINESLQCLDGMLGMWALAEYLPRDALLQSEVTLTGAALKVKERDLAQRRMRQAGLVPRQESQAYAKYARVHNVNAQAWRAPILSEAARLVATPGRAWQPVDVKELQEVLFKDLAAGFLSRIDYRMERFNESRPEAERQLERVRQDNAKFPLIEFQNPGAMVDGAGPRAGGIDATKTPGTMNPDFGSNNEKASVLGAVKRTLENPS